MKKAEFKIVSVIGARPQFVKAAVVSRAFQNHDLIQEILVHTGQHYDREMDQVFFEELRIPSPAYHLGVGSGSHATQTGRMMRGLEEVLEKELPQRVLVYGDTNSTLAGALVAAKLNLAVDHVEAGLRSFNRAMPEEVNRIVADRLSALLFCPTNTAVKNLAREGIIQGVHQVGDVMYDAVLLFSGPSQLAGRFLEELGVEPGRYFLMTIHRAENTARPEILRRFFAALGELDCPVLFPVHPRTANVMKDSGIRLPENVRSVPPVSYFRMVQLEKHAMAILTDSGGMQKEAYFLRTPCLTLREETEWVETVHSGWNRLVGLDPEALRIGLREQLNGMGRSDCDCFGDGKAAAQIAGIESSVLVG